MAESSCEATISMLRLPFSVSGSSAPKGRRKAYSKPPSPRWASAIEVTRSFERSTTQEP